MTRSGEKFIQVAARCLLIFMFLHPHTPSLWNFSEDEAHTAAVEFNEQFYHSRRRLRLAEMYSSLVWNWGWVKNYSYKYSWCISCVDVFPLSDSFSGFYHPSEISAWQNSKK